MKKHKRKKNMTILFVPDDSSKVFSLKMKAGGFFILLVLWILSCVASGYIVSKHVNYRATLEYNKYLKKKNKYFAGEVVEAKENVRRVAKIDSQLRDMLQLKSKKGIIKYTGFGGPSDVDGNLLEKSLKSNDEIISKKAFELAVKYINEQSRVNEESFREIVKYITEQRAKLSAVPAGWPVKGWITCGFGSRIDPFSGALSFHRGVDIANDKGTPVKAPADGVVSFAAFEKGYGNLVTINHGNGYSTRYGHLKKYVVSPGQQIKKGQVLGYVGNTGRSTAPHLHYEVKLNGVAVNPVKYLNKKVALK